LAAGFTLLAWPTLAAEPMQPWQLGFQPAASPLAERLNDFHNYLLWFIIPIAIFVLLLLVVFGCAVLPLPPQPYHPI
jgi:cytochrome c oxidase subunit 2